MTNKAFNFVQPIIDIPSDLSTFKQRPQVRWTGNNWQPQSSVSVGYGPAAGTWTSTNNFTKSHERDLYSPSQDNGLRIYSTGTGREHEALWMMDTNSRWMPASVFNGVGFETWYRIDSGNTNHSLYVNAYGVVFKNRTGSGQRIYGWNTGNTDGPGSNKYRFDRILSSDSGVTDIRRWGENWLLQGLLVSFKTKGSGAGTTDSLINLYNLKFGSQYSSNAAGYKVHPLAVRPYNARNMHPEGTNKFAYFKQSLF